MWLRLFNRLLSHRRRIRIRISGCLCDLVSDPTAPSLLLPSFNLFLFPFLFFSFSLAEFPGIFVSAVLINTRGRKQTLAIMLAVYAFFSSLLLVPGPTGLGTFFACVSRGAMLGAYATVYVYTPEAYPTDLRTTSLGACSAFSRIGGVLAPYIARVGLGAPGEPSSVTFPIIFFAVICFIGSILALMLPIETKGRGLDKSKDADRTILMASEDPL